MGAIRVTRVSWPAALSGLVALVAMSGLAAIADGAAPDADTPKLAGDAHAVEMTGAYLQMWVEAEGTRVECVYFLRNRGDSTSIRLPFPSTLAEHAGVPRTGLFRSIRSFMDGVPVVPHTVADSRDDLPGGSLMRWHPETVPFAANQARCVRDVYEGLNIDSIRSGAGGTDRVLELFAGRGWTGPIGTCDVVMTIDVLRPEDTIVQVLPVADSHDGREWRWHFDGILPGTRALPMVAVFWRRGTSSGAR